MKSYPSDLPSLEFQTQWLTLNCNVCRLTASACYTDLFPTLTHALRWPGVVTSHGVTFPQFQSCYPREQYGSQQAHRRILVD